MESTEKFLSDEASPKMADEKTAATTTKTTTTTTTTTSKYVREFESLFAPIKVDQLRIKAQSGNLRHCQFRSLCWRYFLKCLPENFDEWLEACEASRRKYEEIRAKHLATVRPNLFSQSPSSSSSLAASKDDKNTLIDNEHDVTKTKLSVQDASNKINVVDNKRNEAAEECDHKNVFRTIERDVVRTFPDMEFFKQTEMQAILENVLFNYASENFHISYKQGMHELLATLLYVTHTDSQNCLINYEGDYANETIATLLDLEYLEHDVFHLFSALMKSIETWYQNDEILIISEPTTNANRFGDNNGVINRSSQTPNKQISSVLGLKLKKISENIVKNYDLELFNHLEALQIAPQIYGIRWMRLLFGREFEFIDLLTVWDAIICDKNPMSLIDYVFASMLITIREELVNGDYTDCLNNLMRHQFKDVSYVIKLALHLRDPANNSRPKPHNQVSSTKLGPKKQLTTSTSSLTSKLSQQYISDRQYLQQQIANNRSYYYQTSSDSPMAVRRNSPKINSQQSSVDSRDQARKIFSMTSHTMGQAKQRFASNQSDSISNAASESFRFLAQTSRNTASKGKFLPNINKFVSSIGQNIQDKTNSHLQSSFSGGARVSTRVEPKSRPHYSSSGSSHAVISGHQQYHHHSSDLILSAGNTVKEYEMREMQSTSSSASTSANRGAHDRFPLGKISAASGSPRNAFNASTESYDDLHSIVDYCWRLLSEQIDSLQRCLPKEKSLSSEDEIFVALAQLKKVRDVLKGSLRLEDELESSSIVGNKY